MPENSFLTNAIKKFKELSGTKISLSIINNWEPFKGGFFAEKKANNQQISLSKIGSGYEMIFSLLYSFYLSQQGGKQLIVLIDEPELHLHPSLQEGFVRVLLEFSKNAQIIMTSQSPLFIKQLFRNEKVNIKIITRAAQKQPEIISMRKGVLPYESANEINYLAFNLPTVEYHNELYGYLQENTNNFYEIDIENYFVSKKIDKIKRWNPEKGGIAQGEKDVTLQTFIRNKIHHPDNKTMQCSNFSNNELQQSIDEMRRII